MARLRRSVVLVCAGLAAAVLARQAALAQAVDPVAGPTVEAPILPSPLRATIEAGGASNSVVRPVQRAVVPAAALAPLRGFTEDPDEADPYAPLGLRLGSFVLAPELSTKIVSTDNAAGGSSRSPAVSLVTEARLAARSNWERHQLTLSMRGGFTEYLSGDFSEDPTFGVNAEGRIDLTEVDRIDLGAGYSVRPEDRTSDDVPEGTDSAPTIEVLSATAGYRRNAGLIGMALKGSVDRTIYGASGDFDSAGRTNTALAASLRLSLDSGAAIAPFVEGGVFRRIYDRASEGVKRDGAGVEGRAGIAVDTGIVSGEIAAGYAVERFDDAALSDLRGVLVDGSLAWRPTELVTVQLAADTGFSPTTLAGASGSVTSALDLTVDYLFRPNVTLSLGGGLTRQDYAGIDRRVDGWSLTAGAAWRLNRTAELNARVRHSASSASTGDDDSRETRFEAGLTLRR